jgi:hypothetical protein
MAASCPARLGLEGVEGHIPELVQPGADLAQTPRVDLIDAPRPIRPVGHEAGLLQDLQMLRDSGPAHRQALSQFANRLGAAGEVLEYLAARRIGQGGEGAGVSHDLP